MKLKFDPSLDHQMQAVNAVVDVFDGLAAAQSSFEISHTGKVGLAFSEHGVGNLINLDYEQFLTNVRNVQEANGILKVDDLQGRNFSIEMETGTGKTYVYLRTIYELSKKYGLKKFIIVVPSIAIREGVKKSIDITKKHFAALYGNEPVNSFIYDSKRLEAVRQFASSNDIQIMIINIQSFQRDVADGDTSNMTEEELKKLNVINRENDRMSGYKPIEYIQGTNPVVIIDEPQSVDNTDKAKRAITNLNYSAILRYSATHRDQHNLLYKLDPIRAYDLELVKRIEVLSVVSENSFNDAYVTLLDLKNKPNIKAKVKIDKTVNGEIKPTTIWVKKGDDLFEKSGRREIYRGYIVRNIDCTPGIEKVELGGNREISLGEEIGGYGDEIMEAQVYKTVERHLEKELNMRGKGIKVLSLFFIDKVANYRGQDGVAGKIAEWFEHAYTKLTNKSRHKCFAPSKLGHDISKMHNGYFSQDKRAGHWKDSTERGNKDDENTYDLIMRDKERLLDTKEPLRFIFSHSALREGWDNPNVFQICTLNESGSALKKRQEIGRGLRLPVNSNGERIHDRNINILTVIANESYQDFAASLQKEFEEDCGIKFGKVGKSIFAELIWEVNGERVALGQDESVNIWDELNSHDYIDDDGKILDKFDPNNPHFELKIDNNYDGIKSNIVDKIKEYLIEGRVADARERREIKFNNQVQLDPRFVALWDKIKQRTRYCVNFSTGDLITSAIEHIKQMESIKPAKISTSKVSLGLTHGGIQTDILQDGEAGELSASKVLPDILAYLQKETELTRHTLVSILKGSGRLEEFRVNPQQFMSSVARAITFSLKELMVSGVKYVKVDNHYWEMGRIKKEADEGISRYTNNLYELNNQGKCVFDAVEIDSEVERQFAKDLDSSEDVPMFMKLPAWFKIDTPIGSYNPDWAIVIEKDGKEALYLVRETKGGHINDLRPTEKQKTECGKSHFDAIGVDYKVVQKFSEITY